MIFSSEEKFRRMDELSQNKVPFFFFADFLAENIEIYTETEIDKKGLLIDFKRVKRFDECYGLNKILELNSFPESKQDYEKGFELVQKNLRLGNSYLVNYTRKTRIETNYSLEEMFYISKAKYKVYYPEKFVFFSPETFVEIKENQIFTHPMKGTIDAEIDQAAEVLKNNKKEKAEHYTVVDLLRNDLSMVADNVKLDEFQRIDYIRTQQKNLYAMSSEISGILKPEFSGKMGSIMQKLLPAGSILGAPKPKTLEIILQAENYERGFYAGVCGWFDGDNLDSCVMIRFIEKEGENFFFKSGGGITHQSKLDEEYQEMKNKIYVPVH